MKTIFTLLASLIMSMAVFAVPANTGAKPKSMLTVKSNDQSDVRVVLDGKRFESGSNSIMIRDLNSGYHTIKVYRQKNNGFFNIIGQFYEVVYSTSLKVKQGTHITITVDRNGRANVQETKIQGRLNRDRDRDLNRDHDFNYDRDGQWGDYDSNYGYERGMDDREFSQVLQAINKEWLESNKLRSAIQIVKTNSLTSAQVKEMALLFSFENNKLELAKQAYTNTVDKRNYYMINDVFSFGSSKEELNRYIRNVR
jgi:hypothetical protein